MIVTIGVLAFQKGHDVLIRAFERVRQAGFPHTLVIVGEGPLRNQLTSQIETLNLRGCVYLTGYLENPYPLLKRSSLFVLSSRLEGFGLVLAEAMFLGVPVVSTDCESGPREVLEGGKCGMLVPVDDPEAMAEAVIAILGDEMLSAGMKENGKRSVAKRDAKLWSRRFIEEIAG